VENNFVANVLFVGNGPNLLSGNGSTWNGLLTKLEGDSADAEELKIRNEMPFTLRFESIRESKYHGQDLMAKVKEQLSDLQSNQIHDQLMALPVEHVLTTNYDYTLDPKQSGWKSDNAAPETTYSLFRRRSSNARYVWHIHGEMDNLQSIFLGHDNYVNYIHRIKNFLSTGIQTERKDRDKRPYFSKFAKGHDEKFYVQSWVDLFLECDVHMIGFTLDYTENHLWDLIRRKQSLKRLGLTTGSLHYHRVSKNQLDVKSKARKRLLESFSAKFHDYPDDSYAKSYARALDSIKKSSGQMSKVK